MRQISVLTSVVPDLKHMFSRTHVCMCVCVFLYAQDELDPKYSERLFGKDFNPRDVVDILDRDHSGYVST